jgi:hypothetical protein
MLPLADPALVARCSQYWPETDPDAWEWGLGKRGMFARHRETGQQLRIQLEIPLDGGELASGVRCWCVRDSRLILLEEPGAARPTRSVYLGSYEPEGRRLEHTAPPPVEGMEIR